MDYYSRHYVKLSSPTHLQNARFSNQEGHIKKEPEHNVITSASQSAAGAIVCSVVFTVNPPLHLLVSIVQSFCPHPPPQTSHLQTLQFFVTNQAPHFNTLKSILTPRLFTTKAFLTFLSAPRPTSIFGFKPLKYNFLHLLRSLFEKRKPAFIIQNIALLIKIDNDEAVFCHLQM